MNIDLTGKRALVCGSTQGIGLAAARELAALGAEVVLMARSLQKLQEAKTSLPAMGEVVHDIIDVDFTHPNLVAEKISTHLVQNTGFHILVNNTGGPPAGKAIDAELETYRVAFNQHLVSSQVLAKACVPYMKDEGYGRIINIISTSVKTPIKGLGVSNTIRGAVANWSKTLASELGPFGITVNNLLPGYTTTERLNAVLQSRAEKMGISEEQARERAMAEVPAQRFARPEEPGYAIAFLASPAASYINGINLPVDGGRTESL